MEQTAKDVCVKIVTDYISSTECEKIARPTIKNLIRGFVMKQSCAKYPESSLDNMSYKVINELKASGVLFQSADKRGCYDVKI